MKQYTFLILLIITVIATMVSCDDTKTYAELLKDEKVTIADYIKRNNIQVVSEEPKIWPENVYVKTASGLYYRILNAGDNSPNVDSVETNDKVAVRYIQYTLTEKADTISSWNTIDSPYPTSFNFMDYSQACKAWHEVVSYMKRNESEAQIIVTSKLGFQTYMSTATPIGYKLKIQFQK